MTIDLHAPLTLLGGLSAHDFMQHYWQKKPLLIRQAFPNMTMPLSIADLKRLAKRDDVESRLIRQEQGQWSLKKGPIKTLPTMKTPQWTVLVQSVDLHHDAVAQMAKAFQFIPNARFDDVMISLASQGGGVGPHFDTYDVFLLQAHGKRHWRISQQSDQRLVPGLPCRILENFQPEQAWELEPGDMLYLPPQCAHDGIATTPDCVTMSFGFRTLSLANMVRGIFEAAADQVSAHAGLGSGVYAEPTLAGFTVPGYYRDPEQQATLHPAAMPDAMVDTALQTAQSLTLTPALASRFLGCWLTEPNQLSQFDFCEEEWHIEDLPAETRLCLHRQSRMLYWGDQGFINGETLGIAMNSVLQQLADQGEITAEFATHHSDEATFEYLHRWLDDGWLVLKP